MKSVMCRLVCRFQLWFVFWRQDPSLLCSSSQTLVSTPQHTMHFNNCCSLLLCWMMQTSSPGWAFCNWQLGNKSTTVEALKYDNLRETVVVTGGCCLQDWRRKSLNVEVVPNNVQELPTHQIDYPFNNIHCTELYWRNTVENLYHVSITDFVCQ